MTVRHVHTLGDSTLDNLFWMLQTNDLETAKASSVEGQLQTRLTNAQGSCTWKINSLAYDGFTTTSLLDGAPIGAVLPNTAEKPLYIQEKNQHEIPNAFPVRELENRVIDQKDKTHYVVLSVGGNDFRENLSTPPPWRLLTEISNVQKRYLEIVQRIISLKDLGYDVRPILMFQYRTDANTDPYLIYPIFQAMGTIALAVHTVCLALLTAPLWIAAAKISLFTGIVALSAGALGLYFSHKVIPLSVTKDVLLGRKVSQAVFAALIHTFYKPILEQAQKNQLPILDLPNTFDPYKKLYTSGIEPNVQGGDLIAEGIGHIIASHDFNGPSKLYSKPASSSSYIEKTNEDPSSWQVAEHC